MQKFIEWLLKGQPAQDFGPGPVAPPEVKPEPVAPEPPKLTMAEWMALAKEALDAHVPVGPAYKIVQHPAGHFTIERRRVRAAESALVLGETGVEWSMGAYPEVVRKRQDFSGESTLPVEYYETVKNTAAPISTVERDYGYGIYGRYGNYDRERLVGYAALAFNVFADAEAYLKRMADPAPGVREYDFPPLKKRVAAVARKPRAKKAVAK